MSKKYVNIDNSTRPAGDDKYKKIIEQISKDDVCPFCEEHLLKYHKNPIIKSGTFWTLTTNMYPYKNSKYHFLIIHKGHITTTKDISKDAWLELYETINWIENEYDISGGTFFMRCGDTSKTGASVTHLHSHLVTPDKDKPGYEPVIARIG